MFFLLIALANSYTNARSLCTISRFCTKLKPQKLTFYNFRVQSMPSFVPQYPNSISPIKRVLTSVCCQNQFLQHFKNHDFYKHDQDTTEDGEQSVPSHAQPRKARVYVSFCYFFNILKKKLAWNISMWMN